MRDERATFTRGFGDANVLVVANVFVSSAEHGNRSQTDGGKIWKRGGEVSSAS